MSQVPQDWLDFCYDLGNKKIHGIWGVSNLIKAQQLLYGYCMYHKAQHFRNFKPSHRMCLCVFYASQNQQWLSPIQQQFTGFYNRVR
jgi:hypothetical protein